MDKTRQRWDLIISISVFVCQVFGAVSLTALFMYCNYNSFNDPHIFFSSFGYDFFIMQSLVVLFIKDREMHVDQNQVNGHIALQAIGMIFVSIGFVYALQVPTTRTSLHSILGYTTYAWTLLSMFTGIYSRYFVVTDLHKWLHIIIGGFAHSSASCCYILVTLSRNVFLENKFRLVEICMMICFTAEMLVVGYNTYYMMWAIPKSKKAKNQLAAPPPPPKAKVKCECSVQIKKPNVECECRVQIPISYGSQPRIQKDIET